MPLYAIAWDIVDNWAPVKLNFWTDVKSRISCNILCKPCWASLLAFLSSAGSVALAKVVMAPHARKWDTIGLISSFFGIVIHPFSSQLVNFLKKQSVMYFKVLMMWSGAKGGVF